MKTKVTLLLYNLTLISKMSPKISEHAIFSRKNQFWFLKFSKIFNFLVLWGPRSQKFITWDVFWLMLYTVKIPQLSGNINKKYEKFISQCEKAHFMKKVLNLRSTLEKFLLLVPILCLKPNFSNNHPLQFIEWVRSLTIELVLNAVTTFEIGYDMHQGHKFIDVSFDFFYPSSINNSHFKSCFHSAKESLNLSSQFIYELKTIAKLWHFPIDLL